MKLISCYIENFGNLSEVSYNFDSNLTSFYHENGYGKSTLGSFIKAMFYGLESYKVSTVNFVDRMHYYPFNKKAFGGNLTFEYNGKTYKIERFFDEKSETKDTFKLYENGNESNDFDESIGQQIFAIDKKSFERLMFVTDEDIEIKTNTSINSKLNTLLEGRDDTNLDEVLKELEKVSKQYKDSTSKGSKVLEVKNKAKILKEDLVNKKAILESLKGKYIRLDELKKQISELKNKQQKALSLNEYKANLETYQSYIKDAENTQKDIDELDKYFTKGVPSKVDLDLLKQNVNAKKVLLPSLSIEVLNSVQQLKLSEYKQKYEKEEITEEKLNEISKTISIYNTAASKIETIDNTVYKEEDLLLEKRFSSLKPTNEEIEKISLDIEQLNKDKITYQNMDSFVNEEVINNEKTKPNKIYLIIAIICGILALASIPMFIVKLVVGIIILAVSIVVLLVDGFMYLNNKQSNNNQSKTVVSKENIEKIKLKSKIENEETIIKAFFVRYGYDLNLDISVSLFKLKEDVKQYEAFIKQKEIDINGRKGFVNVKTSQEELLNEFFKKYKINEASYQDSLDKIKKELNEYKLLNDLLKESLKDKETLTDSLKEKEEAIKSICIKYDFEISTIENDLDDIILKAGKYDSLTSILKDNLSKAKNYKEAKSIDENVEVEVESLDEINEKLSSLEEAKVSLTQEIDSDEAEVASYQEDENEYNNLLEKKADYLARYDIFEKTINSLKKAEQNLKDKYIGPVKNRFIHYSNILEKALGDKLEMSKDFEIFFERNGQLRSEKHLSSGFKSICALCFRLALLDNMYLTDKPFIILDDPFVLLDEKHLEKTHEIIKELSKDIQIVYFTCHNSRKI